MVVGCEAQPANRIAETATVIRLFFMDLIFKVDGASVSMCVSFLPATASPVTTKSLEMSILLDIPTCLYGV